MYKASAAAAQGGPADQSSGDAASTSGRPSEGAGAGAKKEGEVIDAEYVDVDDKK